MGRSGRYQSGTCASFKPRGRTCWVLSDWDRGAPGSSVGHPAPPSIIRKLSRPGSRDPRERTRSRPSGTHRGSRAAIPEAARSAPAANRLGTGGHCGPLQSRTVVEGGIEAIPLAGDIWVADPASGKMLVDQVLGRTGVHDRPTAFDVLANFELTDRAWPSPTRSAGRYPEQASIRAMPGTPATGRGDRSGSARGSSHRASDVWRTASETGDRPGVQALSAALGRVARLQSGLSSIGATGFEPATARPPAECATRLRHAP